MKLRTSFREFTGATDKNRKFVSLLQEDAQAHKPISPTGQVYLLPITFGFTQFVCIFYLLKKVMYVFVCVVGKRMLLSGTGKRGRHCRIDQSEHGNGSLYVCIQVCRDGADYLDKESGSHF